MSERRKKAAESVGVYVITVAALAGTAYVGHQTYRDYQRVNADVETTCTVVEAGKTSFEPDKGPTEYALEVRATHEVDGTSYEGVDHGQRYTFSGSDAPESIHDYPVGGSVPCRYVKGSPDLIQIFPKTAKDLTGGLIGTGILSALAIFCMYLSVQTINDKRRPRRRS